MAAILSRPQCVNQVSLKFAAAEGLMKTSYHLIGANQ